MQILSSIFKISFVWMFLLSANLQAAPPQVDLELIIDPNAGLAASSDWLDALKDLGFSNLRVRQGQRGDAAEVRTGGSAERPIYSVRGIVTNDNILRLPGGNFRLGDKAGIRNWKEKLQDGGQEGVTAQKVMYGLTSKQMLQIHDHLKSAVAFSTTGEKTSTIINKLADELRIELAAEGNAVEAVKSNDPVLDEFQGLAAGTVLAAVLRPLGCVYVPEKKLGADLRLVIRESSEVEKPWPVGWEIKGSKANLAPEFYKTLNSEINDFALSEALGAIQKRVELPFLFDHNNMLRQRVQLDQVKVSTKKARRTYASVVDEILYQGKLKAELRMDEAEKPFLWITTLKQ